MVSLLTGLFGCPHRKTTFPRTRLRADGVKETYMVCLDCAKQIPYNWTRMRVGRMAPVAPTAPEQARQAG